MADINWNDVLARARAHKENIAQLAMQICAVAAPTFDEGARAAFVAAQYAKRGYIAETDEAGNLYIVRRGRVGGRVVLAMAHLDTVFPHGTDLTIKRDGDVIRAPGIGDNAMSIAATLGIVDVLDELKIVTGHDLVFCHNVGEEGLGNLKGAWAATRRYEPKLVAVVAIDGHYGRVLHTAVGSERFEAIVTGPGGHSYGAFGKPSAIHGLARGIADVAAISVPEKPKTTFNVGLISGGTSVNTIAARASAIVDVRSEDAAQLAQTTAQIHQLFASQAGEGLSVDFKHLGSRPAGRTRADAAIVEIAKRTLEDLGTPPVFESGSTDANVPISLGIPAITIGVYEGEGAHSLAEQADIGMLDKGVAQVLRVLVELAEA